MQPTFEIDDGDRICLPLGPEPSALSLGRARDPKSEFAASVGGSATNGNKLSPGLADRDIRGQGMAAQTPSYGLLPWRSSLSLRHTRRQQRACRRAGRRNAIDGDLNFVRDLLLIVQLWGRGNYHANSYAALAVSLRRTSSPEKCTKCTEEGDGGAPGRDVDLERVCAQLLCASPLLPTGWSEDKKGTGTRRRAWCVIADRHCAPRNWTL
jgi:hypothetical protein